MELLSKLTPAETSLLLNGSQLSLKDLLKYTFIDLILKKVIRIIEVERQPHPRDRVRYYTYVAVAQNFETYKPISHELIFLATFLKSVDLQIQFRHLIKIALQNADTKRIFINKIVSSPHLIGHFESNFLNSLLGRICLSPRGTIAKNELMKEIGILEKKLPIALHGNKREVVAILNAINGNVFLINNLDLNLLKLIDQKFFKEFERTDPSRQAGCYGGCWHFHDSYSSSFDKSYDSADTSYSEGGSGCTSCGGGCGGCGGD